MSRFLYGLQRLTTEETRPGGCFFPIIVFFGLGLVLLALVALIVYAIHSEIEADRVVTKPVGECHFQHEDCF